MCPQQYFLEYVLGWVGPSNQKADLGTITHKVLEVCGVCKKAWQNGLETIEDDICGTVLTNNYDRKYLEEITNKVFDYYSSKLPHHEWTAKNRKDIHTWVTKVLDYNSGMFDPRFRQVVDAEPHFDFEIKKRWAKFNYDGHKGYLSLKGTIDLITDVGHGVYEIIDWKTGKRLDWVTGEVKDQQKLYRDPQLRLYHYAAKHMYPKVDQFITTIGFINDGGFFSVYYDDDDFEETEQMIRKRFEEIKEMKKPTLNKSWKCTRLCHQGKTTFENTQIAPMKEFRMGVTCGYGTTMTKCEQTKYMVEQKGMDWVMKNYTKNGFDCGSYKSPGKVE